MKMLWWKLRAGASNRIRKIRAWWRILLWRDPEITTGDFNDIEKLLAFAHHAPQPMDGNEYRLWDRKFSKNVLKDMKARFVRLEKMTEAQRYEHLEITALKELDRLKRQGLIDSTAPELAAIVSGYKADLETARRYREYAA